MGNKKLRDIEEIQKEVEEPKYDYIEKFSTISDDKKSLLIRIPQEIRAHFKINKGDKIRFYSEFRENEEPKLNITIIKEKNAR